MIADILGYIGMVGVLVSLYLSRKHYVKSQVVALITGPFMTIYSYIIPSYPLVFLNAVYSVIAIFNLTKLRRIKNAKTDKG